MSSYFSTRCCHYSFVFPICYLFSSLARSSVSLSFFIVTGLLVFVCDWLYLHAIDTTGSSAV
ncbi:hypothetical protein BC826DRAFT_1008867 [Russula brevipes]|nr:hypothetical protein BC826DRAFT_1008867 [Russula brevipes]